MCLFEDINQIKAIGLGTSTHGARITTIYALEFLLVARLEYDLHVLLLGLFLIYLIFVDYYDLECVCILRVPLLVTGYC